MAEIAGINQALTAVASNQAVSMEEVARGLGIDISRIDTGSASDLRKILCAHITEVAGRATWSEGESAAEGALAAAAGSALAAAAEGALAAAAEGTFAAQMAAAIASQGDAVAAAIAALGPVMAAAIDGGKERGSGGIELAEMLPAAKFPGQSSDSINPREREVFRWLVEAETAIAALQCGTREAWRVVCAKVKGSMSNAEFIVFVASAPKDFSDIGQISTYVVEHMCPLAYTAAEEAQRTVTIPDPSSIKSRAAAAITKHATVSGSTRL